MASTFTCTKEALVSAFAKFDRTQGGTLSRSQLVAILTRGADGTGGMPEPQAMEKATAWMAEFGADDSVPYAELASVLATGRGPAQAEVSVAKPATVAGAADNGAHGAHMVYVGAWHNLPSVAPSPPGVGISIVRVNDDGSMVTMPSSFDAPCASGFAMTPDGTTLFSTMEAHEFEPINPTLSQSSIEIWAIGQGGALEKTSSVDSNGFGCCHIVVHPAGGCAVAANYGTGNIISIGRDLQGGQKWTVVSRPAAHTAQAAGFPGAHAVRQEGPHAHQICLSPTNPGHLYVPDLGANCIVQYALTPAGELTLIGANKDFAPGAGPRHMVFHPTLPVCYMICELHSVVYTFSYDGASGALTKLQENISTLPPDFEGREPNGIYDAATKPLTDAGRDFISASAIRIHPNGLWLYGSNRGDDSIASFTLESGTGLIEAQSGVTPCDPSWTEGEDPSHPRDFTLVGDDLLLVANQNTSRITTFKLEPGTGVPAFTGNSLNSETPVALLAVTPMAAVTEPEPTADARDDVVSEAATTAAAPATAEPAAAAEDTATAEADAAPEPEPEPEL